MRCERCGYGQLVRFSGGMACHLCSWEPGNQARDPSPDPERHQVQREQRRLNRLIELYRRAGVYGQRARASAPGHESPGRPHGREGSH